MSAEDDYFTAEESFDEDEDDDDDGGPNFAGRPSCKSVRGGRLVMNSSKKQWRAGRSRSTFDSEIDASMSLQSSVDYAKHSSELGRCPRREDSTGSAGFVLEQRSAYSRPSESDIASSAGRLFYRGEREHSQYASVDSTNWNCSTGGRLKGRRYHRQIGAGGGGLKVVQCGKSCSVPHRSLDRRCSR